MTDTTQHSANPFPAEAVATYGGTLVTCSDLTYMRSARDELNDYMTAYARDEARYGAAIGLRGGHGSGKTHVLGWLVGVSRASKSIRSTALYAKCDSCRFFDLYRQLMEQFNRESMIDLIHLALLNLARAKVRTAKVTESLAARLETANGLQVLQAEHNVDLEQLRQDLLQELLTSEDRTDFVRILLEVPHPARGELAYRWLCGVDVPDVGLLGVTHQLRSLEQLGIADADRAAITMLETIAVLHRIARVPLLILVDQLEVMLRTPDQPTFEMLGSVFKKFIEQVTRQAAMVFIAGVPEAWKKLPRDVSARLRRREEIVVGSLSMEETRIFLDAYTIGTSGPTFTQTAGKTIHQLSGGSPREILRIAHQAYAKTHGKLSAANDDLLLECARLSGTISDRTRIVLTIADAVLPEFGTVSQALVASETLVVDRAVLGPQREVRLLLLVLKATDAVDEIDSARRAHDLRKYQQMNWPKADLVIVAVGYSSAEVLELLHTGATPNTAATAIAFKEDSFEAELRSRVVAAMRTEQQSSPPVAAAPLQPDAAVAASLSEITARLKALEERRVADAQRVHEQFSRQAEELARPAVEERRLVTRREVLDALEALQDALMREDTAREQALMRSILVTNEAYLHNSLLDELGELYLDTLALVRHETPLLAEMRWHRDTLMQNMRESLRRPTGLQAVAQYKRLASRALIICALLLISTGVIWAYSEDLSQRSYFLLDNLSQLFGWLILAVGCFLITIWCLEGRQRRRRRRMIQNLRERIQANSLERSLRSQYPQAS